MPAAASHLGRRFVDRLERWAQQPTDSIRFRQYYNDRRGFCVSYPADWDFEEDFNHAGIRLSKLPIPPVARISVGALPDQPRGFLTGNYDDMTPMTLHENVQHYLKLDPGDPVGKVELIESRSARIAGLEGTMTIVRLTDRKGGLDGEDDLAFAKRRPVHT